MLNVFIKTDPNATIPTRATNGSAGYDLTSTINAEIHPNCRLIVPTGVYLEIPTNFEAQIRSRSGLAAKHGVFVLNSPGTIDSDYRGEIKVILFNTSQDLFTINVGDRIAQMVFAPVHAARFIPTENLQSTGRNQGGFGSTGTH